MAGNPFYYQNGQQPQTFMYQQPTNSYIQPMTTAYTPSTSRSSTLYGRIVNSPNDITPNEVPIGVVAILVTVVSRPVIDPILCWSESSL